MKFGCFPSFPIAGCLENFQASDEINENFWNFVPVAPRTSKFPFYHITSQRWCIYVMLCSIWRSRQCILRAGLGLYKELIYSFLVLKLQIKIETPIHPILHINIILDIFFLFELLRLQSLKAFYTIPPLPLCCLACQTSCGSRTSVKYLI